MPECGCHPKPGKRGFLGIEQVEEDERLEPAAEVGGAHQAGDGSLPVAKGAMHDPACARLSRRGGFGHEESPLSKVIVPLARCFAVAWSAAPDPMG